jgi:CheY-like chemotaxis protein
VSDDNVGRTPGQADPGRHVRHDVRTLIGQICGYSELMLEEAEQRGWGDVAPELLAIQSTGKELLGRAGDLRASTPAAFMAELGPPIVALLTHAERARSRLSALADDDVSVADVERIQHAGRHLLGLVTGALGSTSAAAQPADAFATPSARAFAPWRPADTTVQPGRIVVVDDDLANRDLLRRRLERLGCSVAVAEHGRQALETLGASPFDLVLLDIVMPEMDGYETLGRLKSDPTLQHVPVIVLSAVDEVDSAVRCIELGAEDYLSKPINPSLLRVRVETCLEKKRLRDQETAYLREVARVTAAAADIEAAVFDPESLADLAAQTGALGRLVRVVQDVAAAYTRQALLAAENARLLGVLRQQLQELERSRRLIATADERLRQEIAELLHSRVQNRLLLAWYRLEECREIMADQPARARSLLEEASQQLDQVREHDVRQVSHLLHPSIIQVGLVPAVERLADDFLPQFRVELEVDGALARLDDPEDNRLPEPVRLAAYRVLEEALGNAARHARANRVDIALGVRDEQLAIRVRDDGQGFDPRDVRVGLGLSCIAARVGCVAGTWRMTSAIGQGTTLEALLPLAPPALELEGQPLVMPVESVAGTPDYDGPGRAAAVDTKRLS